MMIKPSESSERALSKPIEIKIPDTLFIRINTRKNHVQFTDLRKSYAHYSVWFYDSTFDLHKTLEPHNNIPKKQIPIFKREWNWKAFTERFVQDMRSNCNSIVRVARTDSSDWKDLDLKFIPVAGLKELFSDVVKGNRWTFGVDFFDNFESAFHYAKLGELAVGSLVMGWSSEGHFMFSYGKDCVLFNTNVLSESIEKSLQLLSDSRRH
jgi:hypothetical protein